MAATLNHPNPGAVPSSGPLAKSLRVAIEIGVLLLVCLTPWAFGGGEPVFEFIAMAWLAVLLVLWGLAWWWMDS